MPRQLPQLDTPPYTKVLSALLKTELLRLCVEFRLPTDGSVVHLRQRLKGYINLNRNALFANPRYTGLFPRRRRLADQPPPSPTSSTSSLSYTSSTHSFDSWHGIGIQQTPPPQEPLPPIQLHQPHQPLPHELHAHPPPSPSPSARNSEFATPPPVAQPGVDGRKFPFVRSLVRSTLSCHPYTIIL